MWEEGQNWRGHTGKKRQKKFGQGGGLRRQSPGILECCFVSRAWSSKNNSERDKRQDTTLQNLLKPRGFKEREKSS